MSNTSSSYKKSVNKNKWEEICGFLLPWLSHPETNETIEQYYEHHRKYCEDNNLDMPVELDEVLGLMMFMSQEQIVIYPQDDWQQIDIFYEEGEPVGYNIVPKIIVH